MQIKNLIIALLLLLALPVSIMAMPVKPGMWRTIKLTDGTEIRAEICGDEHYTFMQSADGRTFQQVDDTDIYMPIAISEVKEKAYALRKAKAAAVTPRRAAYTGTKKCLCILVEFMDKKFTYDRSLFNDMINKVGYTNDEFGHIGSVRDYFREQSYGQFDIEFDVVGPYTLDHGYKYYGSDSNGQPDINVKKMIEEAVALADPDVNYRDYDWNDDRTCESIYIIYAGMGQTDQDEDPDVIWPVQGSVNISVKGDRAQIASFACGPELSGITRKINGIGTMCHEYSHNLGFPDTYDIDYSCGTYGVSYWDLMSLGNYNDDNIGNRPSGYNALEKWQAGWIEPIELNSNRDITNMRPLSDSGEAYVIYNDDYHDEYYLIENRQQKGFDSGLPGSGLLIYHVDYDQSAWFYNVINCTKSYSIVTPHPRFTLVCADNSYTLDRKDMAGDAFPYGDNNSLTASTTPSPTLYHANADGVLTLGRSITNIRINEDGTASFRFTNDKHSVFDPFLPEDGIEEVESGDSDVRNAPCYNLSGQRVRSTSMPGMYIRNGKKWHSAK